MNHGDAVLVIMKTLRLGDRNAGAAVLAPEEARAAPSEECGLRRQDDREHAQGLGVK